MEQTAAAEAHAAMPWAEVMGFELVDSEPGSVTLRLDPKPEFHNQNGTVAAPISFALAEATGVAVFVMAFLEHLGETYTVVRDARLEFVAAARGPITSTAQVDPARIEEIRAIALAGGEVDEPVDADVRDASGRVVAKVSMTMAIRPIRG